jgi:5-methylcytosine-specific restriction endonuclease McrA
LPNDNTHRQLQLKPEAYNALRRRVLERDRWLCQFCGHRQQLDIHHIIPRSRGGSDSEDNLITLCRTCHGVIHGSCQKRLR